MGRYCDEAQMARQALADYYGTAAVGGMMPAFLELSRIEAMNDEEAVEEVVRLGLIELGDF